MRYIEVERAVFKVLFKSDEQRDNCSRIEYDKELTFEVEHCNSALGIVGRRVFNRVSMVTQYYLKDINA